MVATKQLDWKKAEEKLDRIERSHRQMQELEEERSFRVLGIAAGLRERYEDGERTVELYESIINLTL